LNKNSLLTISVDVSNTENIAGKEVVQLYIRDKNTSIERPYKELKGFKKISLMPGQTKTFTFTVDKRALSVYDEASKTWVARLGLFKVLVRSFSRDIRQHSKFEAVLP
jgi:beta-glucosidase